MTVEERLTRLEERVEKLSRQLRNFLEAECAADAEFQAFVEEISSLLSSTPHSTRKEEPT